MRIIQTADLTPHSLRSKEERDWVYNGLDCCVTVEVLDALKPQLDNLTGAKYAFARDLQGPILDMNMRGILVDQNLRAEALAGYQRDIAKVQAQLYRILQEGIGIDTTTKGKTVFWRSRHKLQHLFYGVLALPPVRFKGKVTVNRDALEKLSQYFLAEPLVAHILLLRDLDKKAQVLRTGIDPDGRIRTSFNIAGTNTGRLSSSQSEFGESGGNLQNVEQKLRAPLVADPGKKLAYIDLEQAESRAVGAIEWNLFHDGRYLDACESGDLHTSVCRLAWKTLPWTNDLARDREIAERPFYRQHSYRHMSKVLGHGTNYLGTPHTMSLHTKIEVPIIRDFQSVYFEGFPAHQAWHQWTRETLLRDGFLVSLMGRKRWFFGRRNEEETVRGAVAFDPQGSVGDILNTGMLQVWRLNICDLLLQVHDAILVQYPEEQEDEIIPKLQKALEVPVPLAHGRTLLIPSDAKVGWSWAEASEDNPDGLMKYRGHDSRKRQRLPGASILDRRFY